MTIHAHVHIERRTGGQGFGCGSLGVAPSAGYVVLNVDLVGEDQSLCWLPRIGICLVRLGVTDIAILRGRISIVAAQTEIHGRQQIVRNTLAAFDAFVAFSAIHPHVFDVQYMGEDDLICRVLSCHCRKDGGANDSQ